MSTFITCTHIPDRAAEPRSDRCDECGSRSSLRLCTTCGHFTWCGACKDYV